MKCDNCNKTATVHLTEIKHGKKIEKHLCEQCAAQNEGLPVKSHTPINELLTKKQVSNATFQTARAVLGGDRGVVDLVGTLGMYQLVAMMMVVDQFPLPEGVTSELKVL